MNKINIIICFLFLLFGKFEEKRTKLRNNGEKINNINYGKYQGNDTDLFDNRSPRKIISFATDEKYKSFLTTIQIVNYVAYLIIIFYIIGLCQRKLITKKIWSLFCSVYCCSCCNCCDSKK